MVAVVVIIPVPCPCGGAPVVRHYQAYSIDSSFDYIGCNACDVALMNHEKLDDEAIARWNFLFGGRNAAHRL